MSSRSLADDDLRYAQIDPPQAYPEPGVYDCPQMITLESTTPAAVIHYTMDGSPPNRCSPMFDPYRLIPMFEFGQEVPDGKSSFIIRAITTLGDRVSEECSFKYEMNPRKKDEYLSNEISSGVRMIRDYENDKMYLVIGTQRALLIDAGMGSGDLRGHIEKYTHGLPIDVVITHAHPDHIAKMGQFQSDCQVYMHHDEMPMVKRFIEIFDYDINPEKIVDVREGFTLDLGDRKLDVYELPGHSKGSIVLMDEKNGILFSGDAIGSNRPTIVDALWMQRSETMIDEYLSILQVFRSKVAGKIKVTYGGHNDTGLMGEKYLDMLQEAAQKLVDQGPEVLVPSPRPTGAWQVVNGNRLTDPNWAAINVNPEKCLTEHPNKIASLSNIKIIGGSLTPQFHPSVKSYQIHVEPRTSRITICPISSSHRYSTLKINDVNVPSNSEFEIKTDRIVNHSVTIGITSPDQTVTSSYTLQIT